MPRFCLVSFTIRSRKPSQILGDFGFNNVDAIDNIPGVEVAQDMLASLIEEMSKQQELIKQVLRAVRDNPHLMMEVQAMINETLSLQPQVFEMALRFVQEDPALIGKEFASVVISSIQNNQDLIKQFLIDQLDNPKAIEGASELIRSLLPIRN